jgi:hypothetical protein
MSSIVAPTPAEANLNVLIASRAGMAEKLGELRAGR